MLDASKAFDSVHRVKLFYVLFNRDLCPLIIKMLIHIYTNQKVFVKCGSKLSAEIKTTNGVKQEGILSPVLYTLYIDVLLLRIRKSGFGCHVGNVYTGCIGYADGVVLITPTLYSLKYMLNLCDQFGKKICWISMLISINFYIYRPQMKVELMGYILRESS